MARMDVTPQELRGSEIKEAWRGFNRDEVDDLLERAAATIEALSRRVHELETRAPADPAAITANRDDAEMLQRTLMLAQRAADDAVNEAQAHARQVVEESEARAQALVSEAESTARRIAENERRRLEEEIGDLAARRAQLSADADALEQYVAGYRDRVRGAIESDLERLGSSIIEPPSPRPSLREVDLRVDFPEEPRGNSVSVEPVSTEPVSAESGSAESVPLVETPRLSDAEWPPPASAPPEASVLVLPREEASPPMLQSSSWISGAELPTSERGGEAPWEHATAEHQPFTADTPLEANPVYTDDLDDDAFFASLRDAVNDGSPLGPRPERHSFFDDEPDEERRSPFRRRR
jgi:cell division initiation protein